MAGKCNLTNFDSDRLLYASSFSRSDSIDATYVVARLSDIVTGRWRERNMGMSSLVYSRQSPKE
jgi:hypothetical protein